MNEYALLINDQFQRLGRFKSKPEDIPHKNVVWLPVVHEMIDNSTLQEIYTYMETTSAKVNNEWKITTTKLDRDQQWIDAYEEEIKQTAADRITATEPSFNKAIAIVLFELVNEVRTLKGQQTITVEQFKTYLKSKL